VSHLISVQLNVPRDLTGDKTILLDGKEAGTFRVQAPGGLTNP
jgi:hypothetical protein